MMTEPVANLTTTEKLRILVVEDEYIVAFDICAELESLGYQPVGPAGTVEQAILLAETEEILHGAVLDVNVNGREVFPVADLLTLRKVPFIFSTGYDKTMLPLQYQGFAKIEKPVAMAELGDFLKSIFGQNSPTEAETT